MILSNDFQAVNWSDLEGQFQEISRKEIARRAKKILEERRNATRRILRGVVTTLICEVDLGTAQSCDRPMKGRAVDASSAGLQFCSDTQMPVGAVIDLMVDDDDKHCSYNLTGEVRWVFKQQDDPSYYVGMQLVDRQGSDYQNWKEHFNYDA